MAKLILENFLNARHLKAGLECMAMFSQTIGGVVTFSSLLPIRKLGKSSNDLCTGWNKEAELELYSVSLTQQRLRSEMLLRPTAFLAVWPG
ncbi:hypothetical protein HDF15_001212 [Granulicella mallensis]|uniref:Uncharacterized protein n=1 Tax=Granulicella mallensis TaxID=940614 RepID=A0A7W7ZMV7_9BACT|nr:hypothetical protein [Granulicella mallensis]